ncbi:MAG: YigZ family protein [Oscillospiraceae bacterium]|jgi:putative IMPACT (imprinted ancient) family translation regulator|nr:YigZ family protein [Oscillospiraceae bacterium]
MFVAESEIKVKRSRFLARIYRCSTEAEAYAIMLAVKRELRGASHWVYAYVLSGVMRSGDNGEPPGTAGLPVLNVLRSAGLSGVVCIVTRWFGGTKLGVAGLRAAYKASAIAAAEAAIEKLKSENLTDK